ncbi:MAG: hypothetical protein CMJ78_01210 [Planctomycetaceae bacterium]|nr:hypothetical protein [Planctomycetaceae bacterium]
MQESRRVEAYFDRPENQTNHHFLTGQLDRKVCQTRITGEQLTATIRLCNIIECAFFCLADDSDEMPVASVPKGNLGTTSVDQATNRSAS